MGKPLPRKALRMLLRQMIPGADLGDAINLVGGAGGDGGAATVGDQTDVLERLLATSGRGTVGHCQLDLVSAHPLVADLGVEKIRHAQRLHGELGPFAARPLIPLFEPNFTIRTANMPNRLASETSPYLRQARGQPRGLVPVFPTTPFARAKSGKTSRSCSPSATPLVTGVT